MGLFDFLRPKSGNPETIAVDNSLREQLREFTLGCLTEEGGRIRVEDAVSAAATVVAERCIDAAGDYPLREHHFPPGQRVLSTKVNELICGDVAESVSKVPGDSVVGILRSRLDPNVYLDSEFPALTDVFAGYAKRIGNAEDWGKAPLSVPESHFPRQLPLRVGYETRDRVDKILAPVANDKSRCLRISTESLADILSLVASALDHQIILTLAIETINGMAKTAPMTTKAMQQISEEDRS